jgi:hypothetical protein
VSKQTQKSKCHVRTEFSRVGVKGGAMACSEGWESEVIVSREGNAPALVSRTKKLHSSTMH